MACNIRELANVVERAMIGSRGRTLVLDELLHGTGRAAGPIDSVQPAGRPCPLADVERD